MRFGSVCSGIEAASAAWHPLGWQAAWLAEIEPFPSAVLAHHYPATPNLGDMTTLAARVLAGEVEAPPLLVGGTPCQSFSVAGLRESLTDARGNLALAYVELANAVDAVRSSRGEDPAYFLWENVPGVLSTHDNAFGCLLAGLVGADAPITPARGKWPRAGVVSGPTRVAAWRVLDAQFFGVAQRRRRVFVLARGGPGRWRAADALLPVIEGLRWHPAPSRAKGQDVARSVAASFGRSGGMTGDEKANVVPVAFGGNRTSGPVEVATACNAHGGPHGRLDFESETFVVGTLGAGGKTAGSATTQDAEQNLLVPIPFDTTQITSPKNFSEPEPEPAPGDPSHPLARGAHPPAIAFHLTQDPISGEVTPAMSGGNRQGCATLGVATPILEPGRRSGRSTDDRRIGIGIGEPGDPMFTLPAERPHGVQHGMAVRRLTPRECERLQGFPDDYTAIPGAKDGPRYRALGNSMAVPVMRHIGRRIMAVERSP